MCGGFPTNLDGPGEHSVIASQEILPAAILGQELTRTSLECRIGTGGVAVRRENDNPWCRGTGKR